MANGFIVPTGYIIKEYLEEYNISQKDLCQRIGMSQKHISNLLNGKSRLTEDVALKLESIFKDVPASYWLNYEVKYRLQLARETEDTSLQSLDLDKIAKTFNFADVFSGLDWDIIKQAKEMLKLLGISDFKNFAKVYSDEVIEFMEDGGETESIIVWLKLCESEIFIQNDDLSRVLYSKSNLESRLDWFKDLALNSSISSITDSCKTLCNELGIYLVVCKSVTNSKVRGALTTFKGHPTIYLSGRFKTHDHIWFAFMHELGHLIMHYDLNKTFISIEDDISFDGNSKEKEANKYASDVFIAEDEYLTFIRHNDFTEKSIRTFAVQENIRPGILVGRLQREKLIARDKLNYLKDPIEI